MTSNAQTKLATSWRTLVPVAVLSAAVGFFGGRIGQSPDDQPGATASTHSFSGVLASLYPTGDAAASRLTPGRPWTWRLTQTAARSISPRGSPPSSGSA